MRVIIGLLLLILLAGFLWLLLRSAPYLLSSASELKPNEYFPILLGMFTALLGLAGAITTQVIVRGRERESAHRAKKAEIYFDFIDLVGRSMLAQKEGMQSKSLTSDQLLEKMMNFKNECVLWGSEDVLIAIADFQVMAKSNPTSKDLLRSMDRLYRAMRKDIGLKNSRLKRDFFAKWPLRDASEFDKL